MKLILIMSVSLYAAIVLRFLTAEQFETPGMSEEQRGHFAAVRLVADFLILFNVCWFILKLFIYALL